MGWNHLLLLLLAASSSSPVSGLKFGPNPVSVDTEVLVVGQPARLTCNFVKYRTEAVREVDWFAGYSGFRTRVFHYSATTGAREASELPFIRAVEAATATDSEISVELTEFR